MINQKRLVDTFLELVKIDSPSGSEGAIAKHVAKILEDLGLKVQIDSFGNVIGKLEGIGEPFMLNAHLDTVEPGRGIKPIVKGDIIKTDESTILGGDDKAGVSAILEALTSIVEGKVKHLPVEVVFTLAEEVGALGAKNLDYSLISAKRGVAFDGEAEVFNVATGEPGMLKVDLTIIVRSAHARAEPEKGISAIKIISEIISELNLGRIDAETTANVGLIEGGSVRNAVPERAHFKGEIRSRNNEKLKNHLAHFQEVFDRILEKYPEAKIELELEEAGEAYILDIEHKTIKHVHASLTELEIEPKLAPLGGLTDVNVFHKKGIEAVVVGAGGYNMHTKREYVVISQMEQAARVCEKLVRI